MIWLIFIQVIRIPAIIILGYWILIQVLSGYVEYGAQSESGIAWFAHIGGFVTGLLLIIMMKKRGRKA
jgi:membrane associated rhomboid family serine protease